MPGLLQRKGEDGPTDGLSGSLAGRALKAAAYPPAGGNVHADPPEETGKHANRTCNSQVEGSGGVACLQYPGAHQHRDVDARGEGCRWRVMVSGLSSGWSLYQEGGIVVSAVECGFGSEGDNVRKLRTPSRGDENQ